MCNDANNCRNFIKSNFKSLFSSKSCINEAECFTPKGFVNKYFKVIA